MNTITIEAEIQNDIKKVWEFWNSPEHIAKWAFASNDWECPYAENDLKEGGKFTTRMSAKDGSASFDFNGIYTKVIPDKEIAYTIEGGRKVSIHFEALGERSVKVTETFEMEGVNSEEMQRAGWQSILNNFKQYVEQSK